MLHSPCLNCCWKDLPKEDCSRKCDRLHRVQRFQSNIIDAVCSTKADFSINDETSIKVNGRDIVF